VPAAKHSCNFRLLEPNCLRNRFLAVLYAPHHWAGSHSVVREPLFHGSSLRSLTRYPLQLLTELPLVDSIQILTLDQNRMTLSCLSCFDLKRLRE
jgi:hypothetical protein